MKAKSFIVCLCLVALSFGLKAQSKKVVKQYNYLINQAELAICDDNLSLANDIYLQAFTIKKPLARELRTAFWVAVQTQNNARILQIAKQRIELGGEELNESYRNSSPNFDTTIYIKLTDLEKNTPKIYDTKFDTILEKMMERDQVYRRHCEKDARQDSLDEENRKLIRQLYREYPDFNEYVAGLYYTSFLHAVLLSSVQTGHYEMQPLLKKKVIAGVFPADDYIELEAHSSIDKPRKHEVTYGPFAYYIQNTFFVELPENVKQANRNRAKLGMAETVEDAAKKYVWEHSKSSYLLRGHKDIFCFGDEEDAAEIEKTKKEIDEEHAKGDFHRMYY